MLRQLQNSVVLLFFSFHHISPIYIQLAVNSRNNAPKTESTTTPSSGTYCLYCKISEASSDSSIWLRVAILSLGLNAPPSGSRVPVVGLRVLRWSEDTSLWIKGPSRWIKGASRWMMSTSRWIEGTSRWIEDTSLWIEGTSL